MITQENWVPFTREELGWDEPQSTDNSAEPELNFENATVTINGKTVDPKDVKYLFQERPTLGEFTGKMLGAGADQVQGLVFGGVGLAGDVVGSDTIKDFGLEGYQRNMQDAAVAREEAGMIDADEIDGFGSAAKFAYGSLLENLPQLAPTIALGGAGGIAGRQLVKKGLQEVIEEGVSAGLSRKAAEAAVANAVASRGGAKAFLTGTADKAAARQLMEGGFTREATEAALGRVAAGKLAPQAGVTAGNIASGQAMSMGSIYGDTEDAGLAVTYGAAAGAVEGLADTILFSPFAKRAFGVDVAERSAKNKSVLAEAGKGFVKGVAVEGPLEEYPQTYIEQLAKLEKDPNYYGPDGIDSEQAKRERLNAAAAGSVVGGTIGPVGGALEALAPRTKNALQGLVQKPLSDPETGLPPNETDPFTSEAREYEPEAYDIGNGINARRFKIKGTETTGWAIDNPTEDVLKEFGNSGYVDDGKLILTANSAGNTLAVRGDTARAKALGKIQEDDDQEEQSQEPEKREPLDFDLSTEGEADPNADVLRDYGIKPAVSIKPAPEAVGRRVRYEGYEGTLTRDGARYKISTPDNQTVELPADTEVEMVSELPAVRGDSALTTAVTASPDANLVSDYGIKKTAEPAPAPEAPAPEPAPGITRGDAWELSQSTLALPEVNIVDAIGAAAETEDLDDNAVSLLDDAQKSLENAITQIEKRDIPQAEKEEATKPLYDKLVQVDETQQLYTPEKAPSALLTPTTPLEQELEKQTAEHQQKVAEQKQAQAEALGARTPEQTQGFVASLKPGDNVTAVLDGQNDITGTFEGTTDEGQGIVKDKKTRKRRVVPKENLALATNQTDGPTKVSVLRAKLGEAPSEQTLTGLGFKSTGGTTTERIGDKTFDRPTYTTTEKDKVDQRPLTVTATFYNVNGKATPNYHYVHEGNKEKKKTWTRDILRAMDRGYEVRIPNSVEVPAGVQTEAVEGTDYRVVTGLDFTFDGVNFGTFLRGNKGVRHNGREDEGVFAEAWNTNPDYNNIRLQRSIDNNKARQEHGTDSTTKAGKRASGLNPIGQSIFQAIFGSPVQDENKNQVWPTGSFGGSIEFYLNTRARGLDEIGRDGFTYGAQDKFFRAIGKTKGLTDDADLSPEQQALVDSTISAYLSTQRSGGVEFAGSGKLTQDTINKLKKDLTSEPKSPEAKLVNRTLNAMQALAMFSNPRTQVSALSGVAATEYKKQAVRPKGSVSLNQNIGESGEATVADILTVNAQGGARAQEEKENLNAAPGEVSKEQKATNAKQEKVNAEIANSLGDDFKNALGELKQSLNPAGKIAFDWVIKTDKAAKQKLYGQLEDRLEQDRDETSPDDIIADVQEEIAGLARRTSGRTYSPAVRSSVGSSGTGATAGLEGGVLNRTSKTAEIRRIKRRYIQGKAGLTDEQMLAMSDDEIDRAYLAYNARADEARAAKAQDAVVSAAPAIDQLVDLDSASLLSEYARELAQDLKAGEMGKIREANFAELTRLGAFASTREFLSRIADPAYKMPRDMQLRAKAFLDLEKKRGFKLDAIEIQAANFLQTGTQDRASWAGLMGRNADYTSFGIYLNLDQAHDRFSAANTALHELSHVTVLAKKHGKVKLSKDEEKAISDLETLRRRAVLRAGDASPAMKAAADAAGITDPAAKVDFYEKEIRKEVASNPEFRGYNGLQNFDEFVVEMTGSPEFVDLLARLGFGTATGKQGFSGMIRDAFKAILKLINSNISADSEIGRAFMDSWNLIYAGTKPTVAPGELLQATRGITAATKPAATVKKSQKPKAPQPAPAQPSTTPNAETTQAPQSNNQPTAQPVPENAEVPEASRPGEGSGAAVEKRGKGRPPKREMRDRTALPATREAFEEEMAQGEMTPEEREAELADEQEAPQSPAGRRPRAVQAAPFAEGEREMAELRADNFADILFYNGITEEDYDKLIDEGILTPNEIEMGYMQDVPKMLGNIADDDTVPSPLRHVAQMMLDQGHDFSKVRFRISREETDWAGLYTPGRTANSGEVAVQLGANHGGGIAQTIVHEALHHVSYYKASPGYRLNATERKALRDIERIRQFAERAAIAKRMLPGENVTEARRRLQSSDRSLYGLTEVDEFITEILTNPSFQSFLVGIKPMQGIEKKGGLIRNLLDQVLSYLKDFIFGMDVSGDSLLTQGLDNVMSLIQTPQDPRKVSEVASMVQGDLASRATYAGEKAEMPQFRRDSLDAARAMVAAGKTPEEIRAVTGWFPGKYDGKMRWEIPDDKARFISIKDYLEKANTAFGGAVYSSITDKTAIEALKSGKHLKIKDVLEHEGLFQAYPKAKEIPFFPLGGSVAENGSIWKIDGKNIILSAVVEVEGQISKKSLSTLLHELQHWVQDQEGFAPGGSPNSIRKIVTPEVQKKSRTIAEVLSKKKQIEGWIESANKKLAELPQKKQFILFGDKVDTAEIKRQKESLIFAQKELDGLYDKYGVDKGFIESSAAKFAFDAERKYGPAYAIDPKAKFQIYQRIAGEIESRDTESRIELTEEQRKATEPYSSENIAPEDAILLSDDGALKVLSPAGDAKKMIAKLTGAETKTTFTGGTYKKGGLLSTDGKLDKRAGDLWRKRNMQVGKEERMVNIAAGKLDLAMKAAIKKGQEVSPSLMTTALGNLDNPLTQAQRAEIKRLREIDEEAANAQEGAYMAKNREAFKVKQAEALRRLPTEIAEAIQEMTEHITALSGALKKAGILEPGLAATIDANLGIYLNRSFEIFDNPAHKDKIKKDEVVMTAAENLLRRQIESRNAQKLIDDVAKAGGILSKADAERQARGTAKREEIDRVMEQLLAVGEESLGGVILRGRIPGQKDLSILDARGNIAPEIQALWGRYEDPTINYAKTVMKISTLVANHQFLAETRSLGLQEGWLYEGDDHPPGYLKIASENNKSLAPLSGLYGNRDLVEALYAMYPPAGIAENYEWVKLFSKLTGMSMASKTVLSAASHVRNFAGNFLNLAASGNLGINDILNGGRYKKALDLTIRSTFSNASAQQFKDTIKELVELGVLNESLTAGLLNDLIGTKRVAQNPMDFSDRILDMLVKKPAAAIWDNAQKSYQSGDEFFKVVIYLSELDKYRKAMPQWSEQQLKENAAKIARDVHWTYSLSPVAVGKIKQFPFIAPFITFTTEVIRTTKNTMELAYREIKEGNRTGNKELAAIGWKRVRGMGIAAFAPTIIAGAVGAAAGISGEDDDDLRRFLPDWQKNSQLLVFKNKDGKVSFIDVSYLDPYEYWKRPITAFLRALGADSESTAMERIAQGAVDAGAQLLNPFAAEQILSGAILDIARNKKESGQELWNPQDTGTRIAAKIGDHLWNAMEPGTLVTAGRIINAATGTVSDSGRSYGLMNEIASVALGQRVSELDVEQAFGFKSSQYARNLRDASAVFTREFSSKGTRSADQIMDAYNRANDATFDLGKDFRQDLESAIRLGRISKKRAEEIMSAARLSKEDIKMLRTGRYLRYEPSPQQIKLAKELGNENRIRDVRQAERATPTNIPLR